MISPVFFPSFFFSFSHSPSAMSSLTDKILAISNKPENAAIYVKKFNKAVEEGKGTRELDTLYYDFDWGLDKDEVADLKSYLMRNYNPKGVSEDNKVKVTTGSYRDMGGCIEVWTKVALALPPTPKE